MPIIHIPSVIDESASIEAQTAAQARAKLGAVIGTDVAAQTHATQHQSGGADELSLDGAQVATGTVAATRLGTMTGDSGAGGAKGAVPAPAAGDTAAGKYLDAAGGWSVPPAGAGSMVGSVGI